MSERSENLEAIKISSDDGEAIVYFERKKDKFTFLSEKTGAMISFSGHEITELLNFIENVRKPAKAYTVEEKRKLHKMAYEKWNEMEELKLIHLWESGESVASISTQLMRNEGGIRSRLSKLGFDPFHSNSINN